MPGQPASRDNADPGNYGTIRIAVSHGNHGGGKGTFPASGEWKPDRAKWKSDRPPEIIGQNFAPAGLLPSATFQCGQQWIRCFQLRRDEPGADQRQADQRPAQKTADGKDDPTNMDGIKDLAAAIVRKKTTLCGKRSLPADAVTRSCERVDPEITPANADLSGVGRCRSCAGSMLLLFVISSGGTLGR
jgi:hypothetical protein